MLEYTLSVIQLLGNLVTTNIDLVHETVLGRAVKLVH